MADAVKPCFMLFKYATFRIVLTWAALPFVGWHGSAEVTAEMAVSRVQPSTSPVQPSQERGDSDAAKTPDKNQELTERLNQSFMLLRTAPLQAAESAVAVLDDFPDASAAALAQLHWIAGSGFAISEEWHSGHQHLLMAEQLARQTNAVKLLRRTLRYKAPVMLQTGNLSQARLAAMEAVDLCELFDDHGPYKAIVLNELASAELMLGHLASSASNYQAALQIARETSNKNLEAMTLCNLAGIYTMQGHHQTAIQFLEQSLAIASAVGNHFIRTRCLVDLSSSSLALSDIEKAQQLLTELETVPIADLALKFVRTTVLANKAELALYQNDVKNAVKLLDEAQHLARNMGDPLGERTIVARLATVQSAIDRYVEDSEEILTQLIEQTRKSGSIHEELSYRQQLVKLLSDQLNWEAAFYQQRQIQMIEEKLNLQKYSETVARMEADLSVLQVEKQLEILRAVDQQKSMKLQYQGSLISTISLFSVVTSFAMVLIYLAYLRKRQTLEKLRQAQAEIRHQQQRQLAIERNLSQRQKSDSISLIVAGICHDFNNMLMAISGQAEIGMLQSHQADRDARFEQIVRTAMEASALTRNLMEYVGDNPGQIQCCNLSAVVAHREMLLESFLPNTSQLQLVLSEENLTATIDEGRLGQILLNLVANASQAGSGHQQIVVKTFRTILSEQDLAKMVCGEQASPGDYCVLSVTDQGCGITPETLSKIFDPYFTTKQNGKGLGLASVFGIVRGCGGAISVSTSEMGSEFQICIPALPGCNETHDAETDESHAGTDLTETKLCILIVDDDDLVRESAMQISESFGHSTVGAASATQAIMLFRKDPQRFNCVMTDVTMPNETGLWLAEQVRSVRPEIPVIICSGYALTDTPEFPKNAMVLMKPYTARQLDGCLRKIVAQLPVTHPDITKADKSKPVLQE